MKIKMTLSICIATSFLGACQIGKALSFQPQVWEGDAYSVSVTRPGYLTIDHTTIIADAHCNQFGKEASITKLASPFVLPNRDEFSCVKKP